MNRASEGVAHAPWWHNRFALYHISTHGDGESSDPIIRSFWCPLPSVRLALVIARALRPRVLGPYHLVVSIPVALGRRIRTDGPLPWGIDWFWRQPVSP